MVLFWKLDRDASPVIGLHGDMMHVQIELLQLGEREGRGGAAVGA